MMAKNLDSKAGKITYDDLQLPWYTNSRIIATISETDMIVQDVVSAAILARLNTFLIGSKGTGKTQLLTDVNNYYFGGNGLFIEGNPEFTLSQLLQTINLEALNLDSQGHAKTTDDALELTERVKLPFFGADELNRCPPIVQNYFYGLLNGYISFKGQKVKLGDNGYSVGIATGNLGDGEYCGTFKMDEALEDRFALFLNLGHFKPIPEDEVKISRADPRVKDSEPRDISGKIKAAWQEIFPADKEERKKAISLDMRLTKAFMRYGLDYCKKHSTAKNSKANLNNHWPARSCGDSDSGAKCDEQSNYCGMIKAYSPRAADAFLALAKSLQYVAKLKNAKAVPRDIQDYIETVRIAGAYAGNLNELILNTDYFGNPHLMLDALIPSIQKEVEEKLGTYKDPKQVILLAASYSQGKPVPQEVLDNLKEKWGFLPPLLKEIFSKGEN